MGSSRSRSAVRTASVTTCRARSPSSCHPAPISWGKQGRAEAKAKKHGKKRSQEERQEAQASEGEEVSEKHRLLDAGAIVGIGATEFSKDSGRSDLQLAIEACEAAIADAGIEPAQVDGMVTFTADTNPEIEIAKNLGIGELSFFSRIHHGGGAACGTIQQAVLAVNAGVADYVVCYRAFNERSGHRFGTGVQDRPPAADRRHRALLVVRAARVCSRPRNGSRCSRRATCTSSARRARTSVASRWPTASTRRRTRRPGSTRSRSRSRTTRTAAGSSSRCTCSTAARRATAARRSSSRRPSAPGTCRTLRRSCAARPRAQARTRR